MLLLALWRYWRQWIEI